MLQAYPSEGEGGDWNNEIPISQENTQVNTPYKPTKEQQILIDNGFLSAADAEGGWGPKSKAAWKQFEASQANNPNNTIGTNVVEDTPPPLSKFESKLVKEGAGSANVSANTLHLGNPNQAEGNPNQVGGQWYPGKYAGKAMGAMGGLFNSAMNNANTAGANLVSGSNQANVQANTLADGTILRPGQAGFQGMTNINQIKSGAGNFLQGGSQVLSGGAQTGGGVLGFTGGLVNLARRKEGAGGQMLTGLGNTASGVGNMLGGGFQALKGAYGAMRPMLQGAGKTMMGMGESYSPQYGNFRGFNR